METLARASIEKLTLVRRKSKICKGSGLDLFWWDEWIGTLGRDLTIGRRFDAPPF